MLAITYKCFLTIKSRKNIFYENILQYKYIELNMCIALLSMLSLRFHTNSFVYYGTVLLRNM
jgi:hypothetical protein